MNNLHPVMQAALAPFAPPSETRRSPTLREFKKWVQARQDNAAAEMNTGPLTRPYEEFKKMSAIIFEIEQFTDAMERAEFNAYLAGRKAVTA